MVPENRNIFTSLLLVLPIWVLIVPQGTVSRTYVPEIFFAALLFGVSLGILGAGYKFNVRLPMSQANPFLAIMLFYILLVSPFFSLLTGSTVHNVTMTVLPFILLLLYYVYLIAGLAERECSIMLTAGVWAGVLIAFAIIGTYFFGDVSANGRATSLGGNEALMLPALPSAGVLAFTLMFTLEKRRNRLLMSVAFVLVFIAILMTVTRAALLVLLVGSLISYIFLFISRHRLGIGKRVYYIFILATISSGLAIIPLWSIWSKRLSSVGGLDTILGRFDEIRAFFDGFSNSYFFGQGLGHLFSFPSIWDDQLTFPGITVPHNHFAFFAGATGLIGIFLYYGVLLRSFWKLFKHLIKNKMSRGNFGFVLASFSSAATGFLFTLTSTTYTTLSYNVFLAIFFLSSSLKWEENK